MNETEKSMERSQAGLWQTAMVNGMASYLDAAVIVTNGIALVIYQQTVGLTSTEFGLLSASLTLGIAIGALVGGRLSDVLGRRPVFVTTMAMMLVGAAIMAFSTSTVFLVIALVISGLAVGADLPASLASISERADRTNRGKLLGFSQILWACGILAVTGLAAIVGGLGYLAVQLLWGHICVMAGIVMLVRMGLPESGEWIAARAERAAGATTIRAQRAAVAYLLRAPYLVRLIVITVFYSLVNLAANTNGQYGTKVAVDAVGLTVQQSALINLLTYPLGIALGIAFMFIADTRWRMPAFTFGATSFVMSFLVPVIFDFSVPSWIAMKILFSIAVPFAFEAIMKVWTQESFPTLLRSSAQGGVIATARFTAGTFALVTAGLLQSLGAGPLYAGLAMIAGLGFSMAWITFRKAPRREVDEPMTGPVDEFGGPRRP